MDATLSIQILPKRWKQYVGWGDRVCDQTRRLCFFGFSVEFLILQDGRSGSCIVRPQRPSYRRPHGAYCFSLLLSVSNSAHFPCMFGSPYSVPASVRVDTLVLLQWWYRSGACAEVADALLPCITLLRALCLRLPTIKVGRTQKQLSKRTALGSAASATRL